MSGPNCPSCGAVATDPQAAQCRYCGARLAPAAPQQPAGFQGTPPNAPFGGSYGAPPPNAPFGGSYGAPPPNAPFGGSYGAPPPNAPFGGSYGAPPGAAPFGGSYGAPPGPAPFGAPVAPFGGHHGPVQPQGGFVAGVNQVANVFWWIRIGIAVVALALVAGGGCVSFLLRG